MRRRRPVCRQGVQQVPQRQEIQGLPRHARQGRQEHRRRRHRDARPHACRDRDGLHPARASTSTCKSRWRTRSGRCESSPRPPARPRCRPRWATRAIPPTRFGCCTNGSRTAPSDRCTRSMPGATGRSAAIRGRISRSWPGRRRRRKCPRRSIGTCGWARPRTGRITRSTIPCPWRGWWDFGTGALGDMGCHILDPVFWVLKLGQPTRVEATTTHYQPEVANETYPRAAIIRYEFPARGDHASREADLERRPADAAAAEGSGARPQTGRQRHLADRREGHDHARFARRRRGADSFRKRR